LHDISSDNFSYFNIISPHFLHYIIKPTVKPLKTIKSFAVSQHGGFMIQCSQTKICDFQMPMAFRQRTTAVGLRLLYHIIVENHTILFFIKIVWFCLYIIRTVFNKTLITFFEVFTTTALFFGFLYFYRFIYRFNKVFKYVY